MNVPHKTKPGRFRPFRLRVDGALFPIGQVIEFASTSEQAASSQLLQTDLRQSMSVGTQTGESPKTVLVRTQLSRGTLRTLSLTLHEKQRDIPQVLMCFGFSI